MRVLIVEDDTALAGQIEQSLIEAGYSVDTANDGEDGHFLGDTEPYDAVVLDLGLPGLDGGSVLRRWRESGRDMPVLILTARDSWTDKREGLDAGADDYLTKPFIMEELLARLRALIRRSAGQATSRLDCGPLSLDTRSGKVVVEGRAIRLTAQEFKLLAYMMHHRGKVISRTELTEHIYNQDFDRDSNTIEEFVNRVRKKIGVPLIHTVRGLGYQLDEAPQG